MPGREGRASPDILIVEGLNVLQPAPDREDGRTGLAVNDFFDFSIYVDAEPRHPQLVRRPVPAAARDRLHDPKSYFARYADLTTSRRWPGHRSGRRSTAPTWSQNVLPTRSRATLVLRKDRNHSVRYVRLRKI